MLPANVLRRAPARISTTQMARFSSAAVGDVNVAKIQIQKTTEPKPKLPKDQLKFGKSFTDHMLEVDYEGGKGWSNPVIRPFGSLELHPASAALHYALECFEGMKAYVDPNGDVRLFRPDMNMKRMNTSMARLLLPTFDGEQLVECIKELIKLDKDWVPEGDGYSLYIRPTGISTDDHIGVGQSSKAKIFVILSPVGPYYPEGFNAVKLLATDHYVRAWPGGTGGFKVGGNYAPGILPQIEAGNQGYAQNLWLFGDDHEVTEVGTMNLMMHWVNEEGEDELVTPPLTRGDILPGVTRDSILELTRGWGEFKVSERKFTMPEVKKAVDEGRVKEVFGCGTACIVTPVKAISYQGQDLEIPLTGKSGKAGMLAERLWEELQDIQYGRKEHPWSVRID